VQKSAEVNGPEDFSSIAASPRAATPARSSARAAVEPVEVTWAGHWQALYLSLDPKALLWAPPNEFVPADLAGLCASLAA
jgi:hypothetical protein